ncbi:MAG: Aminoglycoside N(6')-acetyltransferase type 1 [Chlamydiae bacterium]|nr:Aminoglycoside N(6')-acetyltransferase type 1 [Chlamydiota bacterium]
MTTGTLTFLAAKKNHKQCIFQWLDKEHVRPYFYGQGLQNTIDGLEKFIKGEDCLWDYWIAFFDDEPFGFLMTSIVKESEAKDPNSAYAKWIEPGCKMITLDILIGEEKYLGRGLAARMIREFLLDKFSDVSTVFIDPAIDNYKAIHVYEKVGFKKLEQFMPSWNPSDSTPNWMMCLKMEDLTK